MQEKNTGQWDQGGWEMRVEILYLVVKENPTKTTAEQRLQYGEEMSLWNMPPSHPLPTVSFPLEEGRERES